jgi:hypothetical protein
MKKAFVFSLMTFLLLFSLLMLSTSYISREKLLERQSLDANIGDRIRYTEDDLISGVHQSLLSIAFTISNTSSASIISFSGGRLSSAIDHPAIMAEYERFIEDNYSILTNTLITLTNFSPGFRLEPYGSSYLLNRTSATLTFLNTSSLQQLRLVISVSESLLGILSNSTPPDTGSIPIQVEFHDPQGKELLSDIFANLNPSASNPSFQATFSGGKIIQVNFGKPANRNTTLLINATNLVADITLVELTLSRSQDLTISDGRLSLGLPSAEVSKTRAIILKQG